MVYFREHHFSLSSLSHPENAVIYGDLNSKGIVVSDLNFMLVPEEQSLVVDFDDEKYEKVFLANFSYEFPVIVRLSQHHTFYGSLEKEREYELKPGQNATFFFVKQTKTWFITM